MDNKPSLVGMSDDNVTVYSGGAIVEFLGRLTTTVAAEMTISGRDEMRGGTGKFSGSLAATAAAQQATRARLLFPAQAAASIEITRATFGMCFFVTVGPVDEF